jgi:hypothetical protein
MNRLSPTRAGSLGATQPRPDLGAVLSRFLEPDALIAEALRGKDFAQRWSDKYRRGRSGESEMQRELRIPRMAAEARETANQIAAGPASQKAAEHRLAILDASEPATRIEAEGLLVLAQDVFRMPADGRAEIAMSAAVYLLESSTDRSLPSSYLLACAIDATLRELKFAPAPSEILSLVKRAAERLSRARHITQQVAEIGYEARAIAAAKPGEELPPPYAAEPWPHIWKPCPLLVEKPKEDQYDMV